MKLLPSDAWFLNATSPRRPHADCATDIYIADDMAQMAAAVRTLDDEIQDTEGVQ